MRSFQESFGTKEGAVRWHEKSKVNPDEVLPFQSFHNMRQTVLNEIKRNPQGEVDTSLLKLLDETYLRLLGDGSARRKELRRFGSTELTPNDMFRSFMQQGAADAHYISTLTTHRELSESINAMYYSARDKGGDVERVAQEIYERYQRSYEYAPNPWVSNAMNVSAVWMLLTKPSYYTYNATQPLMLAHPYMAVEHGGSKAYSALWNAYGALSKVITMNPTKPFSFAKLSNENGQRDALSRLEADGMLENTLMHDIGRLMRSGDSKFGNATERVMTVLRNSASRIEQVNRASVALASYNLAYNKAIKGGATPEAARKTAYDYAYNAVDMTQFDYGGFNKPTLIGKNNFRRFIAQFRTFQFGQAALLVRMVKESGLRTPEQRVALRGLAFLLGHHAVAAGAWGLPAMSVIAFAMGAMLGKEEPFDLEAELRQVFGTGTMGDILMYGVPAGVFGANVSQNLGMGQTFSVVPYSDVSFTREGYTDTLVGLLGPSVGLGAQWIGAADRLRNDDYYGFLAGLMPGAIKFSMRALNEQANGVTNARGDTLVSPEEITAWDTFLRSMGYTTQTDYVRRMARSKAVDFDRFFTKRTSDLRNKYTRAAESGDREKMAELRQEWLRLQEFKRNYGFSVQPISNLTRAPEEKRKRERETVGGIQVRRGQEDIVTRLIGEERLGFSEGGSVKERMARSLRKAGAAATNVAGLGDLKRESTQVADQMYPDTSWMGEADAMRHMMFYAELTRKYGPTVAAALSGVNEYGVGFFQGKDERAMDLHNDRLGRQIGQTAQSRQEIIDRAMNKIESGEASVLGTDYRQQYALGGFVPPSLRRR